MHARSTLIWLGIVAMAVGAAAQNTFPSSGNVGIGTTGPGVKLDVDGVSDTTSFVVTRLSGDSSGYGSYLQFTDGATYNYAAGTATNGDFTFIAGRFPGQPGTERMRLTQVGNVGIGTVAPLSTLHVVSGGGFGGENSDGTSQSSFVPIVAQSDSTAIGILNAENRQVFALNIDLDGGVSGSRGVVNFDDKTNGTWHQDIALKSGSVGIGTTAPGATLEVNGPVKLTSGSGASITFADGTTQSTAFTGVLCGGDYAETVDVAGGRKNYEPGDVLVISAESGSDVLKSAKPYSTFVAGIYSTKPGTVGRRQTTDAKTSVTEVPMAMVGIVPTKVSAQNGSIKRGDLLVSSSMPGYAMKGTDRSRMLGAVIGKAMGSLDSGIGVIEVLVTLQ